MCPLSLQTQRRSLREGHLVNRCPFVLRDPRIGTLVRSVASQTSEEPLAARPAFLLLLLGPGHRDGPPSGLPAGSAVCSDPWLSPAGALPLPDAVFSSALSFYNFRPSFAFSV